jgi:hypothetical protein
MHSSLQSPGFLGATSDERQVFLLWREMGKHLMGEKPFGIDKPATRYRATPGITQRCFVRRNARGVGE